MDALILPALGALLWLAVAIPLYRRLRRAMLGDSASLLRRLVFTLAAGALLAPGLIGLGHPPPVPAPGAAPLGLMYWAALWRGHTSEDGFAMAYLNLASWAIATAVIGLGELWRLRARARVAAAGVGHTAAEGLRKRRPGWIAAAAVIAAVPVFIALNGPVGEPARAPGRVIACGPHVHWLTRIKTPYCGAELADGSVYSFEEADPGVYGRTVTVLRFQRRFVGTHDVVQKD